MLAALMLILVESTLIAIIWEKFCFGRIAFRAATLRHLRAIGFRLSICYASILLTTSLLAHDGYILSGCVSVVFLMLWTLFESVDFVCFRYVRLSFVRVALHSPLNPLNAFALSSARAYLRQFMPAYLPAALFGVGAAGALVISHLQSDRFSAAALILAAAAIVGTLHLLSRPRSMCAAPDPVEAEFLKFKSTLKAQRLYCADRRDASEANPSATVWAANVIIIVNESAGADAASSAGSDVPLVDRLREVSGAPSDWLTPGNAVTGSACTDVSLPCILTGCGTHEGVDKLHALPMIFDLGKQRGLQTQFFTSCTLNQVNFERFFDYPGIDELYSADTEGLPRINELNGDDYIAALRAADAIRRSEGNICHVAYLNALHVPFQNESSCAPPEYLRQRIERAAYILEASHKLIFDALRDTGRFDDSLIVLVGDHGETKGNDGSNGGVNPRLSQLSRTVLQPLFAVKPPRNLSPNLLQSLSDNMRGTVSTLDIAPTVAHFLGVDLKRDMSYVGTSLGAAIQQDRVLYTLNVNQWRAWPHSAVAISRGEQRVVVDYQNMSLLCTDADGQPYPESDRFAKNALLSKALAEPTVRQAISLVFWDKLGVKEHGPQIDAKDSRAAAQFDTVPVTLRIDCLDYIYRGEESGRLYGRLHLGEGRIVAGGFELDHDRRGLVAYGPYVALSSGSYRAAYRFDSAFICRGLTLHVNTLGHGVIAKIVLTALTADNEAVIEFSLTELVQDFEVLLLNSGGSSGICNGLSIRALPSSDA